MLIATVLKPFLPKVKQMITDEQLLQIYDNYIEAKDKEEDRDGAIMIFKRGDKVFSCVVNVNVEGRITGWRKQTPMKEFLLNLINKL